MDSLNTNLHTLDTEVKAMTPLENIVYSFLGCAFCAFVWFVLSNIVNLRTSVRRLENRFETIEPVTYNPAVKRAVRRRRPDEPAAAPQNATESDQTDDADENNRFFDATDSSSKNILRQRQAASESELRKRIDGHRQEINNAPKPQTQ